MIALHRLNGSRSGHNATDFVFPCILNIDYIYISIVSSKITFRKENAHVYIYILIVSFKTSETLHNIINAHCICCLWSFLLSVEVKSLDSANYRTEYTCGTCKCPGKQKLLFCLTLCLARSLC